MPGKATGKPAAAKPARKPAAATKATRKPAAPAKARKPATSSRAGRPAASARAPRASAGASTTRKPAAPAKATRKPVTAPSTRQATAPARPPARSKAAPAPRKPAAPAARPRQPAAAKAPPAPAAKRAAPAKKPAAPRPQRERTAERLAPDKLERLVLAACKSLEDDKAENIVVLDVTGRADYADRLIIATGEVERQLQAMATHLDAALATEGLIIRRDSIQSSSDWVLIDAGDLVIHLFRPEARALYALEKMWGPGSPEREGLVVEASDGQA